MDGMSKILVVDDYDPWCATIVFELEKAGHTVVHARNEKEAVAAAADGRPSLVLIDLLVAAKAGAGFVRKLRSLPTMRNTPLLLATAGTNRAVAQHAVGQAADQIIPKDESAMNVITARLSGLPLAG